MKSHFVIFIIDFQKKVSCLFFAHFLCAASYGHQALPTALKAVCLFFLSLKNVHCEFVLLWRVGLQAGIRRSDRGRQRLGQRESDPVKVGETKQALYALYFTFICEILMLFNSIHQFNHVPFCAISILVEPASGAIHRGRPSELDRPWFRFTINDMAIDKHPIIAKHVTDSKFKYRKNPKDHHIEMTLKKPEIFDYYDIVTNRFRFSSKILIAEPVVVRGYTPDLDPVMYLREFKIKNVKMRPYERSKALVAAVPNEDRNRFVVALTKGFDQLVKMFVDYYQPIHLKRSKSIHRKITSESEPLFLIAEAKLNFYKNYLHLNKNQFQIAFKLVKLALTAEQNQFIESNFGSDGPKNREEFLMACNDYDEAKKIQELNLVPTPTKNPIRNSDGHDPKHSDDDDDEDGGDSNESDNSKTGQSLGQTATSRMNWQTTSNRRQTAISNRRQTVASTHSLIHPIQRAQKIRLILEAHK